MALHIRPISELRSVTCHMGSQCYLSPDTGECALADRLVLAGGLIV